MKKKKFFYTIIIIPIMLSFCGCKKIWGNFVDYIFNTKEIEQKYGEPRTTFYTCPLSDRDPRIPIINPVEMYKDEELGWTLRTSGLKVEDTVIGDCHQIDLMYGDSLNLYLHAGELHYSVNNHSFYQSEKWFLLQIYEKKIIFSFSEKRNFLQKVGQEIVDNMVSPDTYYEMFYEDANSLPWIPNIY
ncbi:MAG: hypothetical protein K6F29_04030 [Bacteroidales bacterium]|jgi:hypothetical protein|nr:hypothetical protein [Bacteroidales bacterium]